MTIFLLILVVWVGWSIGFSAISAILHASVGNKEIASVYVHYGWSGLLILGLILAHIWNT